MSGFMLVVKISSGFPVGDSVDVYLGQMLVQRECLGQRLRRVKGYRLFGRGVYFLDLELGEMFF